jgi:hypothetical protein
VAYHLGEGQREDYPKLVRARDDLRRLLALDYVAQTFEHYAPTVLGARYGATKKWMYGAAEFILAMEQELGLHLDGRKGQSPDSNSGSATTVLNTTGEFLDLNGGPSRGTRTFMQAYRKLDEAISAQTVSGSFETLSTRQARELIQVIEDAAEVYTLHTFECDDAIHSR